MAADDHLHPKQLKMFMSAREIVADHEPNWGEVLKSDHADHSVDPTQAMMQRKSRESKDAYSDGYSLAGDIEKHGVKAPVPLAPTSMAGGHHRVAHMLENHPDDLMPVVHHDSMAKAMHDKFTNRYVKYT